MLLNTENLKMISTYN
jgi:hypothetical protein